MTRLELRIILAIVALLTLAIVSFKGNINNRITQYEVGCEQPYYNGLADNARVGKFGTWIKISREREIDYPPSVKCSVEKRVITRE